MTGSSAPASMGARIPGPISISDIMPLARPSFSFGIIVLIVAEVFTPGFVLLWFGIGDTIRAVRDLTDDLEAAQSRLSFHLKVLKDAGIVTDRRHGRWVYYSLSKEALDEASGFIKSLKGHRRLAVISDEACCR